MSFGTINQSASDSALIGRVRACVAQEGANPPDTIAYNIMWPVCASSDIEAAYESAVLAENPNPGGDEAVITDGMILSAVQAHWDEAQPQPPAGG